MERFMAVSSSTIQCSTEEIVAKRTRDVIIDENGVKNLAKEVVDFMLSNQDSTILGTTFIRQLPGLYPSFFDIRSGDWLFLLHTLNFSLYIPKSTRQWTVNNYTGFWALCSAIKRAIDNNELVWHPNYYMNISQSEMEYIFRGDDPEITLPHLKERRIVLNYVGKTLKKKYKGLFLNCIRASGYNAKKLMTMLFNFDSYQDEVTYYGEKIRLYTKAKILISDLRAYFPISQELQPVTSTLLVDYCAPQVLLHFKAIRYTQYLNLLIRDGTLHVGDIEELELRCCYIYAVQVVCEEVRKMCAEYVGRSTVLDTLISHISTVVDNFIFHYQLTHSDGLSTVPFHYVKTANY
ncbi:queuosine salvage protein-like [Temnothorax curvispinosus]|uniref:Queuosine 5'-phosphate N-glycosylase/hydrolase n=1 Tax=Temnothorax curvispinosus TaxID=300111 RepID=A0A6J1QHT7_9HYME|nr:queuosine salvage protein-like [Temnothorax curvispinosus]